jgi:hypothetical protein
MAGRTDVGLEAIHFLYSLLRIDDEWSVREPRGFTWWAGDYAQRVWAEPCVEDHGVWLSRLVGDPPGCQCTGRRQGEAAVCVCTSPKTLAQCLGLER